MCLSVCVCVCVCVCCVFYVRAQEFEGCSGVCLSVCVCVCVCVFSKYVRAQEFEGCSGLHVCKCVCVCVECYVCESSVWVALYVVYVYECDVYYIYV